MAGQPVLATRRPRAARRRLAPAARGSTTRRPRVDLDHEPNTFTGSATVSLFRLDRIRALGLRFDTAHPAELRGRPLRRRFLLGLAEPVVGILRDARYIYRKRAAGDSTLQRASRDPGRYTDVLRLRLPRRPRARPGADGAVPPWLQHVIVYELSWYLSADDGCQNGRSGSTTTSCRLPRPVRPGRPPARPEVVAAAPGRDR